MATSKSTTKKPAATPVAKKTTASTSKTTAKTATAKKPAATVKKAAAPAAKPAAAAAKKPAARAKAAPASSAAPTPEQRYRMIQDAAYFLAEKNGFSGGAMDYWMAAEMEIEAMISGKGK